ncbi:Major sperm protein [Dirofilaria immitis]|nr:Major sperm protein [Dirofilaria immitis]
MAAAAPPVGNKPAPSTPTPATANTATPPTGNAPQNGVKQSVPAISVPVPPNKPNEPAFQLKIEPDSRLEFKSDKLTEEPCQIEVKLTNPTKDRQTFKIRCTSNDIFRVRPPLGFCDAEATIPIKITFSSKTVPDSGRHYFAFYHMKSNEKEKTARQVWTPQSKFEGVRHGTPIPPTVTTQPTGITPTGGTTQVAATTGSTPTPPGSASATPNASGSAATK